MIYALASIIVVIILQYVPLSVYHIVCLKVAQCFMSIISQ